MRAGGRLEVRAHVAVFKRMRKCLLARARVAARERSCANMGQLAEIVAIGVFGAFLDRSEPTGSFGVERFVCRSKR
jgi:hypothetical protein